jgi:heterodisulfide reductase subunit B
MRYGFFLGCIMPLRYPGIEVATRSVCKILGIELVELEGASCCPAPGVIRSFDQLTWLAIGARNLAIAERKKVDILTVCNGCFGSLFDITHKLNQDPDKREKINKILASIGYCYNGSVTVRHFTELFYRDVGIARIQQAVKKPIHGLKVAVHYGCHLLKPQRLKALEDPERPRMVDELVEAIGATSIEYRDKQLCCGAGGGVRARTPEIALRMTREKLDHIKSAGADCIVNVCPFCHLQYDRGQKDLGGPDAGYDLLVLHLMQLYGLAFGLAREQLGLSAHTTIVKILQDL